MQNYAEWEEVPEQMIVDAAEMAEGIGGFGLADSANFKKVLLAGQMYKDAELTPTYVWCDNTHRLAVYAEELKYYNLH
jgi:hypothetical protein